MKKFRVRVTRPPMEAGGEAIIHKTPGGQVFSQPLYDYPLMAYGGQRGYSLDLTSMPRDSQAPAVRYGRTLDPVDEADATYEAERGEVLAGDLDQDGQMETAVFGGKRHSQGGTPSNKPGFIFSDTKKMQLSGPIVEEFGRKAGKKYTPAQLAKSYDLMRYKKVLDDPTADPVTRRTAQIMLENYQKKLGKLALVQESMKGFPQGIPDLARQAYPELAEKLQASEQESPQEDEAEMMAYGGLPQYQMGNVNDGLLPTPNPFWGLENKKRPFYLNPFQPGKTISVRTPLPELTVYGRRGAGTLPDESQPASVNQPEVNQPRYQPHGKGKNSPAKNYIAPGFTMPEDMMEGINLQPDTYQYQPREYDDRTVAAIMDQKTTSRPSLPAVFPKTSLVAEEDTEKKKKESFLKRLFQTKFQDPNRLPYNAFDKLALMQSLSRPIKTYNPRVFMPQTEEIRGVYDQADYSPYLSAAATRADMARSFGNTSAAMAAMSYQPELMQGILQESARVRGNNLQMANNISAQNNQIRNQANLMRSQLLQDNYDKYVKSQEETDIARQMKRADATRAGQNMVNNQLQMKLKMAQTPQYRVSGPFWDRIEFTGRPGQVGASSEGGSGMISREQFAKEYPGLGRLMESKDPKDQAEFDKEYISYLKAQRAMLSRNPQYIKNNVMNRQAGYYDNYFDD